jgi:uncharacterized paraquat-inducible protein A
LEKTLLIGFDTEALSNKFSTHDFLLQGAGLCCPTCHMILPLQPAFLGEGTITCPRCSTREKAPKRLMKSLIDSANFIIQCSHLVDGSAVTVFLFPTEWEPQG